MLRWRIWKEPDIPTPTTRLGLLKPTTADVFSTADIAKNWQTIDDSPGAYICNSNSRPTWGAAQQGREILEKDTGLKWIWDGTRFYRSAPSGLLKTTTGGWARGQRTTNISTTGINTTGAAIVTSVSNVVVPAGNRNLIIYIDYYYAYNPNGHFYISVNRATTAGTNLLNSWLISGNGTDSGQGGSFFAIETGGLSAGTYSWSFQMYCGAVTKGTSTIEANTTSPAEIYVVEV